MFIDLTSEQRKLRDDLRAYFADLVTPEESAEMLVNRHGDAYRAVVRRMGHDGWLGVGWPKEYGGHGYGPVEQQIFYNEASRADVPLPLVTLLTVGPTLQKFGTQEQKEKFLPGILSGDIHFAIGYSEPEAGTDLAALRTSAVKNDSGDWVVNGQKIFTTGAHEADYIWLACRTGSVESRHRGITILIADTTDPGYSWTPIITADGAHHTNATYFDDVRVPASMLVGEENKGWRLITTQLNHERVSLGPSGKIEQLYDKVRDWAEPRAILDEPEAQRALLLYRAHYGELGAFDAALFPGIAEVLHRLSAAGVPLSLATSKPETVARRILDHFELSDVFTEITGADDAVGRTSKADVVGEALRRLASHTPLDRPVLVGDRHHDVDGAAEHGIPSILVGWGYGAPAEAAGALATVDTPEQLLAELGV